MSQHPKRTIRKFNPGVFQSDQDIIDQFVVREHELDTVLEILRENVGSPSCQHTLVVGPRGRGKTMLLARVTAEIRTDPQLQQTLLPVRFMEESVEVFDIGDFWLEALIYLGRECAERHPGLSGEIEKTHADLARRPSRDDVAGHAKAALLDAADRLERRLVIMVENLQSLCEETDENFGWQLRQSLQSDPEIMLLGSATSHFEALDDAGEPFFELFRILHLKPLGTEECQDLWHAIAGERREARQMRPLEILTGGSPRLLVIVAEFARHRKMPRLLEELVGLVDDHSEYFRGNLNALPKTERRVYAALCDLWRPSTTREVADRARSGVRKTSALLGRLMGRGAVKADGSGRSRLYSVAEPLHCIYYKLRRWRDEAAVVRGLIRFMVAFYGPDETAKILGSVLAEEGFQEVYRRAQKDLDPEFTEIPAGSAVDAYRELGARHRGLGAKDWQIHVAGELLNIGVRLAKSGQPERSIEYNDELIRRFESTLVPEVQVLVVQAFFNRAGAKQNAGEAEAAVVGLAEVVTRFDGSNVPEIQECVAAALLNQGFLQGWLGKREEAIATYDDAIQRFGNSALTQLRLPVAMSLLNKGSSLAALESPGAMDMAMVVWDDLIERFGGDGEPDIQVQVVRALTKKAGGHMKKEQRDAAVAAIDDAVARYGAADRYDLRREMANALELKAMILNQMGRGHEALGTCDVLDRDFGSIAGQRGIPFKWRAMGSRIHALVLEGEESAAVRVFRTMCDDLDVADNEMVGKIVWDTIDLIAAGARPGVFADALADAAEDCEPLIALMAALQRLAGQTARVPEEIEKVVGDVVQTIEDRRG
ncbi:MAG: AAA family ATPase [Gemmatimonadota bacterium]|nr:AAA family ATPase [Gemmatimonadota bacterium]